MRSTKAILLGFVTMTSALVPGLASASPVNLVQNGGFEQTTNGINRQVHNPVSGNLNNNFTLLNNWTVHNDVASKGGLGFVVGQGWTSTGAVGQYSSGFNVWSPNTGKANGFTDSPLGGNYIVADGAPSYQFIISQAIAGVVAGQKYAVSFSWATGQQSGFDGPTTDKGWEVKFGNETQTTELKSDASHGFSGWFNTTMTFTASENNAVLKFLAKGMPNCVPPLVFLDGVSVSAVPEPSSFLILGLGVAGMGLFRHRQHQLRRRRAAV